MWLIKMNSYAEYEKLEEKWILKYMCFNMLCMCVSLSLSHFYFQSVEFQNKYSQKSKGEKQIHHFKDHLPLPKISNHSTYNMRNKTSKEMLDDEIFDILAGRCVSSIHFLLDVLKNNWNNKLQLLIKKSSLKFCDKSSTHTYRGQLNC